MRSLLLNYIFVAVVVAAPPSDYAKENAELLDHAKQADSLTIQDWRRADGTSLLLTDPKKISAFVSLIQFEKRPRMMPIGDGEEMEAFCQCIGDFRLSFPKEEEQLVVFICHWEHLSSGEEGSAQRQIYLTADSAVQLKRYLLSHFPPRSGEEKEANKTPQTTPGLRPSVSEL